MRGRRGGRSDGAASARVQRWKWTWVRSIFVADYSSSLDHNILQATRVA
jgi:hypothetical protein